MLSNHNVIRFIRFFSSFKVGLWNEFLSLINI